MKVVILAGGYGTRLLEETVHLPKPMIEIGGRPLLWHIMSTFSSHGFQEFVIALGYKGEMIKRYFLEYRKIRSDLTIEIEADRVHVAARVEDPWTIHLVDTGRETMTGGRLKRLADELDGTIFFTYGDGLADIDVKKLVSFHLSHGKLATVTAVRPPERFGLLQLDKDRVTTFHEKPKTMNEWVNGGFFVLEPGALDYIEGDATAWEREPCQALAQDGELRAYRHEGFWQCVDTLHELRVLREMWDRGQAPWNIWEKT